ncbi:hypothetical protein [Seinonella peptonophila]|uniref:hypothetical protein n=1 Tax=Seinonella peptonophila TaxID=112248 RepID=UPI0015873858|nr:hypothetical protein [Seinonella peptonophila]
MSGRFTNNKEWIVFAGNESGTGAKTAVGYGQFEVVGCYIKQRLDSTQDVVFEIHLY